MSTKVLSVKSPREHYQADACIVWCFDDRFSKALEKFIEHRGFKRHDLVRVAGGAKGLASDNPLEREFLLTQLTASIKLHNTMRVVLMAHSDCGAYGGLKAFNNDPHAEIEYLTDELHGARTFLKQMLPPPAVLEIQCVFVNFENIIEIE